MWINIIAKLFKNHLLENEKKSISVRGDVKIPDTAFIALPTFSLVRSNVIGTFVAVKLYSFESKSKRVTT